MNGKSNAILLLAYLIIPSFVTELEAQKGEIRIKGQGAIAKCFANGVSSNSDAVNIKMFKGLTPPKPFTGKGQSFSIDEIDSYRKSVWKLWKQANEKSLVDFPFPDSVGSNRRQSLTEHFWTLPDENPMPFSIIQKGKPSPERNSLFLNIHGSGQKNEEWAIFKMLSIAYADSPSVYFIPQIPSEDRYRWGLPQMQYAWEKLFRLAMLSGRVNSNKIFVTGISEGGYGSQRIGGFYADYLAGVGPMAGGEPLENAPPLNYRNIAFAFETGNEDTTYGRRRYTLQAQHAFDSLEKIYRGEFTHRIRLQQGKGHGIDYFLVTPWLSKFVRNPYPTHVSWVCYPMYSRYRNGFSNLAVVKQFNISDSALVDRVVFDEKIDKATNKITLTANTLNYQTNETEMITEGILRIYLCPELLDLSKPVELIVNGKSFFRKKLALNTKDLVESCLLFGDPYRLYPASIQIDFSTIP